MVEINLSESDIVKLRKGKLEEIRKRGIAFPNDFRRDAYSSDLIGQYGELTHDELKDQSIKVAVAGRIKFQRIMGKASFIQIQDLKGSIQLYVTLNALSEEQYELFKQWDLGDIVGASGVLFKTKTGELTVQVDSIQLLTKSLRPLPDKYHGLTETEQRYRKRYLDLIMNDNTRRVFYIRSKMISLMRTYFQKLDFLEVETPMMHAIPGGATARPFITHHHTLNMELYLRIAPELYLKKLVVGGFERVFELNRNFRNEGISTQHNPEFTMIEFYMAYQDYYELMRLTEDLFKYLAQEINGNTLIEYQQHTLDFGKPFKKITLKESVLEQHPSLSPEDYDSIEKITDYIRTLKFDINKESILGELQYLLFEKTVEHTLIHPTFITEFPIAVSPLARRNDKNPEVADRFELFISGKEIANGFSELNDPIDQAARFTEQAKARNTGNVEAMYFDEEYIEALEYALPPTAGEGIGIDRLAMLLTNSPSIRDVLLFPLLRKESQ